MWELICPRRWSIFHFVADVSQIQTKVASINKFLFMYSALVLCPPPTAATAAFQAFLDAFSSLYMRVCPSVLQHFSKTAASRFITIIRASWVGEKLRAKWNMEWHRNSGSTCLHFSTWIRLIIFSHGQFANYVRFFYSTGESSLHHYILL